jgi:DNA-binding NarL/FixJ family response regulator
MAQLEPTREFSAHHQEPLRGGNVSTDTFVSIHRQARPGESEPSRSSPPHPSVLPTASAGASHVTASWFPTPSTDTGHPENGAEFEHLGRVVRQGWATDRTARNAALAAQGRGIVLVAPAGAQDDIQSIDEVLLARGYGTARLVTEGRGAMTAMLQSQRVCVLVLHIDLLDHIDQHELMQVRRQFPAVHWVLAWHSRSPQWVNLVVNLQAKGCIDCDDPRTFGRAIDSVIAGDLWFPRWLSHALYAALLTAVRASRLDISATLVNAGSPLTHREAETLELVREGLTNKQIALRLGVGVDTVKKHVKSIFDKRGLHRRRQAAVPVLLTAHMLLDEWASRLLPVAAELL